MYQRNGSIRDKKRQLCEYITAPDKHQRYLWPAKRQKWGEGKVMRESQEEGINKGTRGSESKGQEKELVGESKGEEESEGKEENKGKEESKGDEESEAKEENEGEEENEGKGQERSRGENKSNDTSNQKMWIEGEHEWPNRGEQAWNKGERIEREEEGWEYLNEDELKQAQDMKKMNDIAAMGCLNATYFEVFRGDLHMPKACMHSCP